MPLRVTFLRVGGHTAAREVRRGDKRLKEGAADIQDGGNRKVGVRSLTWIFWRPTNYNLGKSQAGTNGAGVGAGASGTAPA